MEYYDYLCGVNTVDSSYLMIQYNKYFPEYLILLILNTLTAVVYNVFNESLALIPMRVGVAIINGAGFTLIMVLIIHLVRKYLKINLFIPVLLVEVVIFIIECFLLLNFYSLITPSVLLVILETNPNETTEFFQTYFNYQIWFLYGLIAFLTYMGIRFRRRLACIHFPNIIAKNRRLLLLCLAVLLSYIGLVYYVTQIRHMTSYQMLTGVERVWHSARTTLKNRAEKQKYMELVRKDLPLVSTQSSTYCKIPYVVIILDESISKWHMNAYGYSVMTTPLLNERIHHEETTLFQNIQTPRTITAEALREIMTFHDDSDTIAWYQCHTLPAVMKAAGYYTCWISNQDSFTRDDENSTQSIASTSDTVLFTHQRHSSEERFGYFDEELLPLLDRVLDQKRDTYFICLHMMGAHLRYTNRYPSDFDRFDIAEERPELNYNQKVTVAKYDNCILYNDYVCNEIIKRFEDKEAVVLCFTDHGEEVYDTRSMSGHSAFNPSEPMIKIPFWIWTSETFKSKRGDLDMRIRQSAQTPFNTSNLVHSVMDLCGLQCVEYDETKSLFYLNQLSSSR